VRILNIVNSLDTPVCQVETRRWDEIGRALSDDVVLYTISMDLPIEHVEYVRDQMTEPDYDLVVEAARELRVLFREGTEKSRSEG
jgi:peroxiredoxin